MGYSANIGSFNIDPTKTVGQTQSIAGIGFQPKIILFWWSGSIATDDSVAGGSYNIGFGAAIDSTHRFCVMGIGEDAQADEDSFSLQSVNQIITAYTDADTINGILDFSSMDADGFTVIVDDQFTQEYRISYLALGGTDLTNIYIGNYAMPVVAGNYSVADVGFKPDLLITSSMYRTIATGTATQLYFSLGMATGSDNQGINAIWVAGTGATSGSSGYGYNGECIGVLGASGAILRESFVSFDNSGFTLDHLEGASARYYHYICLKGGRYSVGDITTRTDGNDIVETTAFQPTAILFASVNRALSTQDTTTAHARISIGAATSISNRATQSISDESGLADTETAYANYDSAVYANVNDDAIVGLMDLKSIESNGFTCVMDDIDPSACWVSYLAIGAEAFPQPLLSRRMNTLLRM